MSRPVKASRGLRADHIARRSYLKKPLRAANATPAIKSAVRRSHCWAGLSHEIPVATEKPQSFRTPTANVCYWQQLPTKRAKKNDSEAS